MSYAFTVKTCMVGSQGVGKTSVIHRLNTKQFKSNITPTIGASFSCKVLDVDSYTIRFQMWDTAGQETYKSMLPMYYRKTNLAMIVFDITCMESFKGLQEWIGELQKYAERDCILCIIGNKCDLEHKRQVSLNQADQFAKSVGALYFETSAKTNEGVMEAFFMVSRQLINLYHRRGSFVSRSNSNPPISLEEDTAVTDEKISSSPKRCCS